jgi:hypothetical protein
MLAHVVFVCWHIVPLWPKRLRADGLHKHSQLVTRGELQVENDVMDQKQPASKDTAQCIQ